LVVESQRLLGDDYYIGAIQSIVQILKSLKMKFQIRIHSEATNGPMTISPKNLKSLSQKENLEYGPAKFERYLEFENTELCLNENPIAALLNMATADILIGSKSSFSYIAACAGNNKLSIFPKFWHALLPDWTEADQTTGRFDEISATRTLVTKIQKNA
jgi:hypothetical protein